MAGIFFLILMVSHLTIGKIANPISYGLEVVVFGGGGLTLIRWWHRRRVVLRSGSGGKLPGPPGVALLPAFIGTFCAFAAVDTTLDSLWAGSFAGHWGLIIGAGLIGTLLLAISVGLARDFARGKLPPPKPAKRSAPATPLTPAPSTPVSPTPTPFTPTPAASAPFTPVPPVPPSSSSATPSVCFAPASPVPASSAPSSSPAAAEQPVRTPSAVVEPLGPPAFVPAQAGPPPMVAAVSPMAEPLASEPSRIEPSRSEPPTGGASVAEGAAAVAVAAEFLRSDARTAWAYRRYLGQRQPAGIDAAMGERLLSAIEPGDHVELILDAVAGRGDRLLDAAKWERPGVCPIVAVRTLRVWILLHRDGAGVTVVPGRADGGMSAPSGPALPWPHIGRATQLKTADGVPLTIKLFLDEPQGVDATVFEQGAGDHIRRLPESGAVPPLPDAAALIAGVGNAGPSAPVAHLPTDWRVAEDIACAHMRTLGFLDAEKTGGGRDGGLDVVAENAIAQVKMLALPVGAPPVQQLRGTRPLLPHHLFYSTSGYTGAALAAADEIGVALFQIERDGTVTGVNDAAESLETSGGTTPSVNPKRLVERYAQELAARVLAAMNNVDHDRAKLAERYPEQYIRLLRYPRQALENLENRPATFASLRSALVYFHHTELLAHVFFQELGIPYPEGNKTSPEDSLDSYYD
ncbi:restriction endonuclease [Actinoplanes sp. NPDC048988]|uniref:restriction endonuclease n=1 Tax=Actinoplanes sp. NPDC048988 TaxID=3363901 RepID=UPI00371B684C